MAFIKLIPPKDRGALPVDKIVNRLMHEFTFLDADKEAGQNHVDAKITLTLRMSDSVADKQERLEWYQSIRDSTVFVWFGEDMDRTASCCVMPDSELIFEVFDTVTDPKRLLLERTASVLNYTLLEG